MPEKKNSGQLIFYGNPIYIILKPTHTYVPSIGYKNNAEDKKTTWSRPRTGST